MPKPAEVTRVTRRLVAAGLALPLLLAAGLLTPARTLVVPHTAAASGGIHVSGNRLVDGTGHTVQLRGVNASGTEFVCATKGSPGNVGWGILGGPFDEAATYLPIAAWHANAVRVPLNEDCWLGINGINPLDAGANYQATIHAVVDRIHGAGMVAILDLHWSKAGSYVADNQETMPDADHSPAFWSSVAHSFGNQADVIFDLYNEPHPHDTEANPDADPYGWSCWLSGCTMTRTSEGNQVAWRAAGMQSLVDAVRGAGASNPVLVNGNGWANDPSGFLMSGIHDPAGQLVAGIHSYPGGGCLFPSCWTGSAGPVQPLAAVHPIIVGETGDSAAGPTTYLNQELPFLDSVGVSYLAWTWNPWGNPDDVLIQDWNGTPTTGEGAYYRSHLQSLPGPTAPPPPTPTPRPAPPTPTPRPTMRPPVGGVPGLTVDADVVTDQRTSASAIVSPPFSTARRDELVLALVAADGPQGGGQAVSGVSGAGLTFRLIERAHGVAGDAEIWGAWAGFPVRGGRVTVTLSWAPYQGMLQVVAIAGADSRHPLGLRGGGSGLGGAPAVRMTTSRPGAAMWAVGDDWDTATPRTVAPGAHLAHEFSDTVTGDDYWVERTGLAPAQGLSFPLGATAPISDRWNLAAVEVVPARLRPIVMPSPPGH